MARNKSAPLIYLEYVPIRILFGLFKILPLGVSEDICYAILRCLLLFIPKRHRLMLDNIRSCFPEKLPEEVKAIASQSLHNLARGIALYSKIPGLIQRPLDWVDVEGYEYLADVLKRGKGALIVSGHYGFWEFLSVYIKTRVGELAPVYRPLDNPLLDQMIKNIRGCTGADLVKQHDILKLGLWHLRKNHTVGLLLDQNLYKGGLFVDFFGRPAATSSIASMLARRTGAGIVFTYSRWEGSRLRIFFGPELRLSTNSDPTLAAAEDTQAITRVIESWIREVPGQWLWLHNRWKRKPEPGELVYSDQSNVDDVAGVIEGQQ
jgi:Kdo2-lipid IVA lauroyltransferase/acyltransferase